MITPHTAAAPAPTHGKSASELDVFGLTHPGKVRSVNQDHFLIASLDKRIQVHATRLPTLDELPLEGERLAFLVMVADGVGGGTKGEIASRLTLARATQYVAHSMDCYYSSGASEESFTEALHEAAMQSHAKVVAEAEANPDQRGMATTLTLWIGVGPWAYLLQVGDSRYYVFHDGELTQVTRDQTMAQALVDEGALSRTHAFRTRWAHVLSSSIGGTQTAPVVTRVRAGRGKVHLMCSDGLTKHVSDERIAERLAAMTSAKQACHALLNDALDDGGTDNITIIVGRGVRRASNPAVAGGALAAS